MLRLDLIDPAISGNKWFKLKYNIEKARTDGFGKIVTFGGAYSNHIAATAAACKKYNLRSVGIIRGEEVSNFTLEKAKEDGMKLHFVNRELYSQKEEEHFKRSLTDTFGPHYLVPEGGNNKEGVSGCMEILPEESDHDYIVCACGTGATYAGILASLKSHQKAIGVSVLKGRNRLPAETEKLLQHIFPGKNTHVYGNEETDKAYLENNCITNGYCFNGYAGLDRSLVNFKNEFEKTFNIPLDHIYTNKLVYASLDMLEKAKFKPGSKILIIHSGGLQGNKGFEERYHLTPTL